MRRGGLLSWSRAASGGGGGEELARVQAAARELRRNRGMKEDEVAWDAPEKSVGEVLLGNESRKTFDWEFPYYLLMGGGFALAIAGEWMRADRRVLSWARDEAEERRRRRADGLEVEIGHNYAPGSVTVDGAMNDAAWVKNVAPSPPRLDVGED